MQVKCSVPGKLFCKMMLKSTELCVSVLDGAAASVMSGLLEFVLFSCENPYCKVSSGIRQNTSIAHDGTLFGMFSLAFSLNMFQFKTWQGRGAHESWLIFQDGLPHAQEPFIPTNRNSGQNACTDEQH